MTRDDPLVRLRDFIYERWAVVQRANLSFRDCPELRVRLEDVTPDEAAWFLEALVPHGGDPPLCEVEDDNKHRSDRTPPNADGAPWGNTFFERTGGHCSLRLETIVDQAAMWRLHDGFGWPRDHLVAESPDVVDDDQTPLLPREALDILLLENACPQLRSKMTLTAARSRVGVEAKADIAGFDRLLERMRECQDGRIDAGDSRL